MPEQAMNPATLGKFFFYIILLGLVSHFAYTFAVIRIERKFLKEHGSTETFLPKVRFQSILGHLAMTGSVGYLVAGLYTPKGIGRYLIFLVSVWLFFSGFMRFGNIDYMKITKTLEEDP